MMKLSYVAIIAKDNPGFQVYFPDVPGCFTDGNSVEEATANAKEALTLHLSTLIKEGMPLAPPSPLDSVKAEDGDEEVSRVMITTELPEG